MKNKSIKRTLAALAAASMITATAVPALAAEDVVTATSAFGVEYQIDFNKGAANIGGRRIYFGFDADSPYIRACGWRGGVSLRAREIADLMSFDPAWWNRWAAQYPTVEEWARWRS